MKHFNALIADLDGVMTRTATVHARAWKQTFDEYLQHRADLDAAASRPFDIEEDYKEYVDGKPRYDGVRSFLQSRRIELPEGHPDDPSNRETICGIGNRKDSLLHRFLRDGGVEVFEDSVAQVRSWKQWGVRTAIVSSSRNCEEVLEVAGLTDLFDVRVDGLVSDELNIPGKPAPDIFLEAAGRLNVDPARAIVVEDAIAGVQAGRDGGFGLVVGIAQDGNAARSQLRSHGADVVVANLRELELASQPFGKPLTADGDAPQQVPRPALEHQEELFERMTAKRPVVFLDYDGTLTPIVERPEDAKLSGQMREVLRELAAYCRVAIVSGRDRGVVERFVRLDGLIYAGSHGFDIGGPGGMQMQHEEAQAALPDLDDAERKLNRRLGSVAGIQVERKRFAIAIHYRRAADELVPEVERIVDDVLFHHWRLRKRGGKKIFELQPDVDWDKGRAVLWLLETLEPDRTDVLPIYVGDDLTDEDAFRSLSSRGVGLLVSGTERPSEADYRLESTSDVERFLGRIVALLKDRKE